MYSPPEWIVFNQATPQALTVWFLGIILYNMVHGDIPFTRDQKIIRAELIWPPQVEISGFVRNLISNCLTQHPADRLTIAEIALHPWFSAQNIKVHKGHLLCCGHCEDN